MGAWAIRRISLMRRDEVNVLIDTRIKIYLDAKNLLLYLTFTGNSLWLSLNHQVIPTSCIILICTECVFSRKQPVEHATEIWIYVMSES